MRHVSRNVDAARWRVALLCGSVTALTAFVACSSGASDSGRSPIEGAAAGGSHSGGAAGSGASGGGGTAGDGSSGGASGNDGGCHVALGALGCALSYDDAKSHECPSMPMDGPRFGTCDSLRVYGYGHDGGRTCAYDATGVLVGGVDVGPYHGACWTVTAGVSIPDSCRLVQVVCPTDAGRD